MAEFDTEKVEPKVERVASAIAAALGYEYELLLEDENVAGYVVYKPTFERIALSALQEAEREIPRCYA